MEDRTKMITSMLKVHKGLVLEDETAEILVTWLENIWLNLKNAPEAHKPNNIYELQQFIYEEWAKLPQKCRVYEMFSHE